MNRITINVGFYFEKQHYAQLYGYIPRSEALQIPSLMALLQEEIGKQEVIPLKPKVEVESEKEQSDEQIEADEEPNNFEPMDIEINQEDFEENGMEEMEDENSFLEEDDSSVESISSLSKSEPREIRSGRTKRLKGDIDDLVQLPDKRPRKSARKLDEASEIIRREEKERKRKQYIKKQIEAQEKATLEKILNETGRKLKMRQEKEIREEIEREHKVFKSLGQVSKTISRFTSSGCQVMLCDSSLFSERMLARPELRMQEPCGACGVRSGKYKLKGRIESVCSLDCYKIIQCS